MNSFKRVVPFFDMFDEIPDNAKYLFSIKTDVPALIKENITPEIEGGTVNIIPEAAKDSQSVAYIHYYEVEKMDYEELMESAFFKKNTIDKIKEFCQSYKIPNK